jgi:hypothetical protein
MNKLEYYKNEAERYRSLFSFKLPDVNTSVAIKEGQKLYRKIGKKFVQVNDPYALDGLRDGFWLIKVEKGCTSIRQQIYPNRAPIHAAAREVEDQLLHIIRTACEARPCKTPLAPEEKKDWDKFIKKHGESFNTLHYPSFAENAEKIINVLIGKGDKKL